MKHLYKVIQTGIEQFNICEDKKEKAGIKYGTKMLIRQIITKKHWSENALKIAQENNDKVFLNNFCFFTFYD